MDNIPPGVDFREHINAALNRCTAAVVVIGPKWLSSADSTGQRRLDDPDDFVRIEIEGLLRRTIPVIPVLVYGASMPGSAELPASLAPLAYRQSVIVRPDPDFRRDMEHVASALQSSAAKSGQHPRAQTSRQSATSTLTGVAWKWRARIVLGESVALVLLAVAVLVIALTPYSAANLALVETLVLVSIVLSYIVAFVSLAQADPLRRPGWMVALFLALCMFVQPGIVGYIFAIVNPQPKRT